jgi:predicted metal-binding protein
VAEKINRKPRPFHTEVTENTLKADLEKYSQKAMELGASEAKVIPADLPQVDERVRLKCAIPPCPNYGRCGNCPPNLPELDFIRKAFGRYKWAIFFKNDVPPEDFADINRYYPHGRKHQVMTDEIAAKLEVAAFADGYRFALGLGAGGCRDTMCNGGLCQKLDSGRCPHILKTRPSMEAMGIDVVDLINKVGWEIYPVYRSMDPQSLPCGISVGLVFIH